MLFRIQHACYQKYVCEKKALLRLKNVKSWIKSDDQRSSSSEKRSAFLLGKENANGGIPSEEEYKLYGDGELPSARHETIT